MPRHGPSENSVSSTSVPFALLRGEAMRALPSSLSQRAAARRAADSSHRSRSRVRRGLAESLPPGDLPPGESCDLRPVGEIVLKPCHIHVGAALSGTHLVAQANDRAGGRASGRSGQSGRHNAPIQPSTATGLGDCDADMEANHLWPSPVPSSVTRAL